MAVAPWRCRLSAEKAEMATGVVCRFSSTRRAVTTSSSTVPGVPVWAWPWPARTLQAALAASASFQLDCICPSHGARTDALLSVTVAPRRGGVNYSFIDE